MFHGQRASKHRGLFRASALATLTLFASTTALSSGYYNLGAQWRGAFNSQWLGGQAVFQSGFTTGATTIGAGISDGAFNSPKGVVVDSSSGTIYVTDSTNHRVSKYNSSGVFQGWIGAVLSSPTGGASGCSGATIGTATPGWCTGGSSQSGSGDGMFVFPRGLTLDASGNLYVADYGNHRISKFNSSGVFQGWIGKINTSPTGGAAGCSGAAVGTFTPGWCTGGTSTSGTGDGMLNSPGWIVLDSSGNLFVSDGGNSRISKYDSTGAFQGWIGKIASSPTGGATGCNGAAVGTFTPGWCTGGTATSGNGDGMLNSQGRIAFDSAWNLYVADTFNNRISKYDSSGAFQGWIGKISTSPTGGATGCNGATVGTFTPGWCKGGTAASGTGDGMLSSPQGLVLDGSDNLYVVDNNGRISSYNSSGTFLGWTGNIATSPTSGATGCNGATIGTATPGWCKGGTSTTGSKDGMLSGASGIFYGGNSLYVVDSGNNRVQKFNSSGVSQGSLESPIIAMSWHRSGSGAAGTSDGLFKFPQDLAFDSSKNMYILDSMNYRIVKYNSSGVYQGWTGEISTSPTGGASGCNGAAVGTSTPGWCQGGAAGNGTGDGMLKTPTGMIIDSSDNIYVADSGNERVSKFNSSGVFLGWIGKVGTSPTGGATGCNGAAVGTVTPGWCTGGTASAGTGDGMFSSPKGIAFDSAGNFYVTDGTQNRVLKFNSAAVFQGWIGRIATSPTGGASGCNGATVGTFTPGWCKGGTSQSGSGDGMLSLPNGIGVDSSGNIYVADTNNYRINKYDSTGAFQGWVGKIATSPTGGATGCNGAVAGTATPGWCTGGTSAGGSGDGMMFAPHNLEVTSSGLLLVADSSNNRISKYDLNGKFYGWIGKISTSPTGGDTGCNGAVVGGATSGWCTGGTSTAGYDDGMLNSPYGLRFQSPGYLYVSDYVSGRIVRIVTHDH